jgi:hypothetical protein
VRTIFERTDLSDCTSQYHLFTDCTFIASKLNAEAVGLMFGLTRQNLTQVELVFRGNKVESVGTSVDDLIASLLTTYRARGWPFAAAILELNFLGDRQRSLADVFAVIETAAASALPLKADEIRFFARIIERLSQEGLLSLLPIASGLDSVVRSADLRENRDVDSLKMLHYALKDAEHRELRAIDVALAPLSPELGETSTRVSFVFDEKPSVSLFEWFNHLEDVGGYIVPAPRFVKAERGSYIEYFVIMPSVLCSLLIAMNTVERIVDRLIYIRARSEVLFSRRLPPAIRQRALEPLAAPGRALGESLRRHLKTVADPNNEAVVAETKRLARHVEEIRVETDAIGGLPQDD